LHPSECLFFFEMPGSQNLFYLVDRARYTGCTPRSWRTFKSKFSTKLQKRVNENFADIPPALLDLQEAIHAHDARRIKKVLVRIAQRLFEGSNHSSTVSTHNISTFPLMAFVAWGGLDIVIQLLFLDEPWLIHTPPTALQIWNLCIKIATEIVMVDPTLSWYIFSRQRSIVRRALKLLSFRVTFENAAVMCEQLLASIGPCVDLGSVCKDFSLLIAKMNDMQLALVCRVLALLVNPAWNVQVHDNSHKFTKLVTRLKRVECLMQRNHDLVIEHPQILNRLVSLMKYQVSHLRSMQFGGSFALLLPVNPSNFTLAELQSGILSAAAHAAPGTTDPSGGEDPDTNNSSPHSVGMLPVVEGLDQAMDLDGEPTATAAVAPSHSAPSAFTSVQSVAATLASALLSALGTVPVDADPPTEAQYLQASMPPVVSVQADTGFVTSGDTGGADLGPSTPSQSMTWFFNPSPQQCDAMVEESLSECQVATSSAAVSEARLNEWGAPHSYQADARFSAVTDDALYGGIFGEEARSLSIVSCQSEVLFILSSLLSGRRSTEVWHRLSSHNVLQVIFNTFDSIFTEKEAEPPPVEPFGGAAEGGDRPPATDPANVWGAAPPPHPQDREARDHQSHQNHRHDPETLRKMEYLRLVHEYWDCRDVYELHDTGPSAQQPSKRALAEKLAVRLAKQSEDPCTDNVLTYALEAFIRGTPFATRQREQEFLSGKILIHLVRVIAECKNENRLESEFSLLAEVVKFNCSTLLQLEAALAGDERLFQGLVTVVCARPFHSNLFIRGLILTMLSLQPTCAALLIPRLRCCDACQAKTETHRSEFWEPYSVFVERIQRAKDIVGRLGEQESAREIEVLLACLDPNPVDPSTCTVCFERVLTPTEEPFVAMDSGGPSLSRETSTISGTTSTLDGHQCHLMTPLAGAPAVLPPTLARLIYGNQIRIIRNLMVEISLPQVCRENMCCVTTTLVFFVVAWHSSSLGLLLERIKEHELQQADEWCAQSGEGVRELYRARSGADPTEVDRVDPFRNFFELVCIWLAYYAAQRHYQDTLFYCTHIPMSAWRSTVRSLIDLLPQYYLFPDPVRHPAVC